MRKVLFYSFLFFVVFQVGAITIVKKDRCSYNGVCGDDITSNVVYLKNENSDWKIISEILEMCSPSYTEIWDDNSCRTLHKGAYLGNGDLGVHLGGTKHSLKFYLGKNGFHAGNDTVGFSDGFCTKPGKYNQHILNLAILDIEKIYGIDNLDDYKVVQDIKNSEIRTSCYMGGFEVYTKTYMSPSRNEMVVELFTNCDKEVPLQAKLSVIGNECITKNAGISDSIVWVTKDPNPLGAPFYVQGAVALKVVGSSILRFSTDKASYSKVEFSLPANGDTVKLIIKAEHSKNSVSPLENVKDIMGKISQKEIRNIFDENRIWWKNFWLKSFIKLDDDIQFYWYNHLYLMGSAARKGTGDNLGRAPGHWGPWNRSDDMHWFGNISMNYNGQNPYYGTFSSNHVELIDPYIESVKAYAESIGKARVINRWVSPTIDKHMPKNCRGVEFELSFTSHGTSCGNGRNMGEDGSMPTNAIFGILPIVWKWKYTQDSVFLSDVCYPLMLQVVDFYDDYIGEPINGKYNVYGCVHEGENWFSANDMFSLGAIQFLYREIIAASEKLNLDGVRRSHWKDILNNMSAYRLQEFGDYTVTFRPDGTHDVMDALTFQGKPRNTGLMFTTTFDNISYSSLPAYKIATCNTLDKGNMFWPDRYGGFQDSNDFGMMFVMAVRAGYPADTVIKGIKNWKPSLNGIVSQGEGGGIETAGIIEAINNMLLQSHDGIIRLFPNWDRTKSAQFKRLRAVGAFLVDAKYDSFSKKIDSVTIYSEKGNVCFIQSPFEDRRISIRRSDNKQEIPIVKESDEIYSFCTETDVSYEVTFVINKEFKSELPIIHVQPSDTFVKFGDRAEFFVSASGKGLKYQWQKNGRDIPGAINSHYIISEVDLMDVGSEFRCVVSNSNGFVKSRSGILNPDLKHIHRDRK